MIVLAIVGSRKFENPHTFKKTMEKFVLKYGIPDRVVSGGARGTDTMGEKWGHEMHLPVTSYRPQWRDDDGHYNKAAGLQRNTQIINDCTHVIAFLKKGEANKGTLDSIRKAIRGKKKIYIKHVA